MKDLKLIDALLRQAAALNDAYEMVFPYSGNDRHAKAFIVSARRTYAIIACELRAAIKRLMKGSTSLSGAPRGPKPPKSMNRPFELIEREWVALRDQAIFLANRVRKDPSIKKLAVQYERAARDFALYFWVQLEHMGLATDEMIAALDLEDWLPKS